MKERRALVTGASEGIGRAFAIQLAEEGYTVSAVARNKKRLKELVDEIPGDQHDFHVADLSTVPGIDATVRRLSEHRYTLLINNAGVGVHGSFSDNSLSDQRAMIRLNCDAPVVLSHTFLQAAEPGDAIVNISSVLAFMPMPGRAAYAATKAFLTSFSEALWHECRNRKIYVVDICPGVTKTQFRVREGAEDQVPEWLTQSAEDVVRNAMAALEKRRTPTVFSGFKNRLIANLPRWLPRRAVVSLAAEAR